MATLDEAIRQIKQGNEGKARQMLEEMLESNENNEDVWLWLSVVVDSDEDREICLENVLALNPNNEVAQEAMDAFQAGEFDPMIITGDGGSGDEGEDLVSPATFLDDFIVGDEDGDDLEFPSTMAKSKGAGKKAGRKFNVRILILLALIVIVVLALSGIAAMSLLGGDGGGEEPTPAEGQPVEQPAPGQIEGTTEPEATPTETPTPGPTDTPTQTPTPRLRLPTARPTDAPSPTATQVVSPTPSR